MDCRDYQYSPETIFKVLADAPGYAKWWPFDVKVKVLKQSLSGVDSKIEVWASGGWFRCKVTSLDAPYRVGIQYYDGVVSGNSDWRIETLSNGLTRVSYSIDLEPHGVVARVLSNVINFSTIHSVQFRRILRALDRYLLKETCLDVE